jgi:carbon monoxide dehydrogenase subunit G
MQLIEDTPGITKVEWQLDLTVYLQFPKFIRRLPSYLVQSTGDRLLNQVVRQVSRRLTSKVQADFHGQK